MRLHQLIFCWAAVAGCSAAVSQPAQTDVALREWMEFERAGEERAKQRALAEAAERDSREAAELARRTVERSDRIQDDAFEILVEIHEDAAERARSAEPDPLASENLPER